MDDQDRRRIMDNMDRLMTGISFDELFNQLRSKGMFNTYMENELLAKDDLKYLYWYVTTRGPEAFNQLCEALKKTDHNDLAQVLISHRSVHRPQVFQNGNGASNELSLEEEFPYEKEWTVIQGSVSDIFDFDRTRVYKMRSSPRGLALVININTYVNDIYDEREGSEKDVARLKSILPQLGFEVIVLEDLTRDGILNAVHMFSQDERHWKCDSAMVIIMTHGKEKDRDSKTVYLTGWDGQILNSRDIVDLLSARLCEALRGKPKIFFFQTCRGNNFNNAVGVEERKLVIMEQNNGDAVEPGMQHNGDTVGQSENLSPEGTQTDGLMMGKTSMVRSDSDIFIGYATSPGMVAVRDPKTGSWYIQALCRVLAKHAWHEDLHAMLQTVRRERDNHGLTHAVLDIEETNQGFNKALYFQPGIFDRSPEKLSNGS